MGQRPKASRRRREVSKTNQITRGLGRAPEFFNGLIETLMEQGRALLIRNRAPSAPSQLELALLGEMLLSRLGEASGAALAQSLIAGFQAATVPERVSFLKSLANRFGPDRRKVEFAIEALRAD